MDDTRTSTFGSDIQSLGRRDSLGHADTHISTFGISQLFESLLFQLENLSGDEMKKSFIAESIFKDFGKDKTIMMSHPVPPTYISVIFCIVKNFRHQT